MKNENLYFISDMHFDHTNIIKYCDRPFADKEEMNEAMIVNWNNTVPKGSTIYHLGDISYFKDNRLLEKTLSKLNGNIIFILGNHDYNKTIQIFQKMKKEYYGMLDIKVDDDEIDGGKQRITLCHYPMLSWNQSHRGAWQLFGHHHGNFPQESLTANQFEVSVENINYTPISYEDIKTIITKQNLKED